MSKNSGRASHEKPNFSKFNKNNNLIAAKLPKVQRKSGRGR